MAELRIAGGRIARKSLGTTQSQWRVPSTARMFSSTSVRSLKLAFDLYSPSESTSETSAANTIIFMHGLFGSKRNNRSMSKILARDLNRPVYAIDLRNHGDSPHDPRHDYTSMAEDVEEFIDEHRLKEPALIGHSMGAKVAMAVALRSPDSVSKLISIDNAPVDAALQSSFGKYVEGMRKVDKAQVKRKHDADEILKSFEESLDIRQFLLTNLVTTLSEPISATVPNPTRYQKFRIPLDVLGASLDKMADFPFKDPDAVRFAKPTLFVRGTKSHYVADETLPVIGSFFPCFEVVDVESGHWIVSENPTAFREAAVNFLSEST